MLAGFSGNIVAVRMCVAEPRISRDWYAGFLEQAPVEDTPDFVTFSIGGHRLELVRADEKNPVTSGGTIVYWQVEDLPGVVARATSLGARVYRGPLQIPGELIAQIMDPHGGLLGLSERSRDRS